MEKILLIRLRLLGDLILTIPSIQLIKEHFPQTKIFYVVEESFQDIIQLFPVIHQSIVVPRQMSMRQYWQFRQRIREEKIDTVIDFHGGPKSALLTFLSGCRTRIGYKTANRLWAYTHLTAKSILPSHSTSNQAVLLKHLDISGDTIPPYPAPQIKPEDLPNDLVQLISKNRPIAIHVGAGNSFRDWGIDNFKELINRLLEKPQQILLLGHSPAEQKRAKDLCQINPRHIVNLCGQLTLVDMFRIISLSAVYFGADSGPMHLASLTNTPIVALFGPNIPEISGPFRRTAVSVIQKQLSCRPCRQRVCIYDTIRCMQEISVEEVYEEIIRFIG
jgi:lipopolysaccharide heptosyltransferase II